jgi:hypothetical protein
MKQKLIGYLKKLILKQAFLILIINYFQFIKYNLNWFKNQI